jgi:redox-sensitive bicupin YhaK (pirin superfamily)
MVDSDYQDLLAAHQVAVDDDHARIRLISGELEGISAPTRMHTPVQYLDVQVEAGGRTAVPIPAAHNGFVLVVDGVIRVGPDNVAGEAGQVLWLDFPPLGASGLSSLVLHGTTPARVLVVSGEPLREPVVAYGPFVMNTEAEIIQAYQDFHSGKFGGPTPVAFALAK